MGRTGRYNCHACCATFKVTQGTVFHGTKIPLQKWFVAIALVVNAKKSLLSHQLSRHLDLNQKTAWYIMTRILAEMAKKGSVLLQGIIKADDTYIGGKPRKPNKRENFESSKHGRGTIKRQLSEQLSMAVRLSHRLLKTLLNGASLSLYPVLSIQGL